MKAIMGNSSLSVGKLIHSFERPKLVSCFCGVLPFILLPNAIANEADEPVLPSGDRHVDDDPARVLLQPSDFVPFKPRADVLVVAKACCPRGQPAKQLDVSIRVGGLAKTLRVYGKRKWEFSILGSSKASEDEPLRELPLTYEFALGGKKSTLNPLGMGLDGEEMPRIEDPMQPITRARAGLPPAGFMPIPPSWQQRASLVGTYGKKWLKERWPWFPEDFDYGYFNSAPHDQQVEGYLRGDEELQFDNLHPEHSVYKSRLPGLRLRLFVNVRTASGLEFREVPVKLDTLWIDMNQEKGILVWRGATEVKNLKMPEIEHLLACTEPVAEPPKPVAHYQGFLAQELNPAPEEVAAVPPLFDDAAFEKSFADMDKEFDETDKEMAALEAEADKQLEAEKARFVEEGIDPKVFDAKPAESPAEELRAMLAQEENLTPEQKADIETQIAEITSVNKEFADMDTEFARDFPPPLTREDVLAAVQSGESLDGKRLHALDLSGQDLTGAGLASADLSKADLAGANLAGADLTESNLSEANLAGANLKGAKLDQADLTRADLSGAIIAGISLVGARLARQNLAGADLSQCNAESADFSRANLAGANLTGARLVLADFTDCNLEGADLRNANLTRTWLDKVRARGILLEGADLSQATLQDGADFTAANFRKVKAPKAVFESAILDQADFSQAFLPGCQFGDASLKQAIFDRADLSKASFDDALLQQAVLTRANLLRASFERADLTGADLEGANSYEAGFWETKMKDAKLKGANLRSTLLE